MKRYFLIAALLLPLIGSSVYSQAGDKMPRHNKRMLKELNLTDDQKSQIDKLQSDNQLKAIDQRADIAKLRLQIKDEMNNKTINESKVLDLTKKVSDIQAQLKASAVSTHIKIYNLLDDKQKEIWKDKNAFDGEGFGMRHTGMMRHMREKLGDCMIDK